MPDVTITHRRIKILTAALIGVMAIFVLRLFYMQIIQHEVYVGKAQNEQVKTLAIKADRGEIYGLDAGEPVKLAMNENVYTVFVDPKEVTEPEKVVELVKRVAGGETVDNINELVRDKPSRYKVVARNISRKQAKMLKAEGLAGLGTQQTTRRIYPEGQLASQTLGFVNASGNGQYGVEEQLDSLLKGKDGMLKSVTDVRNVPLTIGGDNVSIPEQNGKNVVLTIDRNVQAYAEKTLAAQMEKVGAKKGSVVVLDPQTGQVMAMANMPTYKPEEFTKVMDAEAFNNAIVTTPYEPGSVIKAFTVGTGIDKGVITAASTYNNTDSIRVYDTVIGNATKGQTGTITMQHALNWSLNTGMVTIAQRLGDGSNITKSARDTIYSYFHDRFGFGEVTGIEVAGEARGVVVDPGQVEGNAVRYSNMVFGQGMNPTMIQVASGFSSLVNGGRYFKPTVIAGYIDDNDVYKKVDAPTPVRQTVSRETSDATRAMVYEARRAFYGKTDRPGYEVGGKTGTSQAFDSSGKYTFNETVGTYLGYGGDTKPRYVIMVQMSAKGKELAGNTDAMPVFNEISNWLIDYMKLQPKE